MAHRNYKSNDNRSRGRSKHPKTVKIARHGDASRYGGPNHAEEFDFDEYDKTNSTQAVWVAKQTSRKGEIDTNKIPNKEKIPGTDFNFHKGVLKSFYTPYYLEGPALILFQEYFKYLGKVGEEDSHGKTKLKHGNVQHGHPSGAWIRNYFSMLILHKYTAQNRKILDVGSSVVRYANLHDEPVVTAGRKCPNPISNRVYCTAPIIDERDVARFIDHQFNEAAVNYPHRCACVGGAIHATNPTCANCSTPNFDYVSSIDSMYYKGVIEEFVRVAKRNWDANLKCSKTVGYFAFNDYHAALLGVGRKGFACNRESSYQIDDKGQVNVLIHGNPAPYTHGILCTNGLDSWSWAVDGIRVVCTVVEQIWNGDVPYRLAKCYFFEDRKDGDENATERPRLDVLQLPVMFEPPKDAPLKEEQIYAIAERLAKYDPMWDGTMSQSSKKKAHKVAVNFARNQPDGVASLAMWDSICYEFKNWASDFKTNERIFTYIEQVIDPKTKQWNGEQQYMVEMQLYKKFFGFNFKWSETVYTAPLDMVMKAYVRLGAKKTQDSFNFAMTSFQKEVEDTLGVMNVFATDAFYIARVIRAQQQMRTSHLFKQSVSISSTLTH